MYGASYVCMVRATYVWCELCMVEQSFVLCAEGVLQ